MTEQPEGVTPLTLVPLFECGCGIDPDCTHGPTELLLYTEKHVMAAHEDSDSDEGFYHALGQPRAVFYDGDMADHIVRAANAYPALVAALKLGPGFHTDGATLLEEAAHYLSNMPEFADELRRKAALERAALDAAEDN